MYDVRYARHQPKIFWGVDWIGVLVGLIIFNWLFVKAIAWSYK